MSDYRIDYGREITLRDFFAAFVMAGEWAGQEGSNALGYSHDIPQRILDNSATLYYRMADAMLKAREQKA